MSGLNDIIRQLESQKTAIEKALEALREVDGIGDTQASPATSPNDRRSAAQKARWAAKRAAEAAAPAKRKGGMTAAGRKRLAEAMKKRWVVKRAAGQPKKRGSAKKGAQ